MNWIGAVKVKVGDLVGPMPGMANGPQGHLVLYDGPPRLELGGDLRPVATLPPGAVALVIGVPRADGSVLCLAWQGVMGWAPAASVRRIS